MTNPKKSKKRPAPRKSTRLQKRQKGEEEEEEEEEEIEDQPEDQEDPSQDPSQEDFFNQLNSIASPGIRSLQDQNLFLLEDDALLGNATATGQETPREAASIPAIPIQPQVTLKAQPNIPAFLTKLYNMVNDPSSNQHIHWSADGLSFIIHPNGQSQQPASLIPSSTGGNNGGSSRQDTFSSHILPLYFKHSNFSSFVRQLNMYGFHKVPRVLNPHLPAGAWTGDTEDFEFSNPHFQRGRPDLMRFCKRKAGQNAPSVVQQRQELLQQQQQQQQQRLFLEDGSNGGGDGMGSSGASSSAASALPSASTSAISKQSLQTVLREIQAISQRQVKLQQELLQVQQQNQLMYAELARQRTDCLRQKGLIDKILRFLASVFSGDKLRMLTGMSGLGQALVDFPSTLESGLDQDALGGSASLNGGVGAAGLGGFYDPTDPLYAGGLEDPQSILNAASSVLPTTDTTNPPNLNLYGTTSPQIQEVLSPTEGLLAPNGPPASGITELVDENDPALLAIPSISSQNQPATSPPATSSSSQALVRRSQPNTLSATRSAGASSPRSVSDIQSELTLLDQDLQHLLSSQSHLLGPLANPNSTTTFDANGGMTGYDPALLGMAGDAGSTGIGGDDGQAAAPALDVDDFLEKYFSLNSSQPPVLGTGGTEDAPAESSGSTTSRRNRKR